VGVNVSLAPEYVLARRVLLDALDALEQHLPSLILVGAQAVYFHAGETSINVPVFTTDADLAIDARLLTSEPEIGGLLRPAGFQPGSNPGHWRNPNDIALDLMVVPHQAGTAKRSARAARLPHHDKHTARIARGLEAVLVDNVRTTLASFEPGDTRSFDVRVAGPAALLTAKAIKIVERWEQSTNRPHRLQGKDALDAFRLLQAVDTAELVEGFVRHGENDFARVTSAEALTIYRDHASTTEGRLAQLAALAAEGDPTIAPSFSILTRQLLRELAGVTRSW
jgi:hypothetical protein